MRRGLLLIALLLSAGSGTRVNAAPAALAPVAVRPPLELTAEEKAWIAAHPVVRVGFSPSYAPFSMPATDGTMEGIDLDFLNLVAQRTGLVFQAVVKDDWPAVERAFAAGEVDLLTSLVGSTGQREKMLLTRSYLQSPTVVVTRTDSPYLLQPSDLDGRVIAAARGYLSSDGQIRQLLARCRIVEFDQVSEIYEAVSAGRADATIAGAINAAYTIKSLHLANLRLGSALVAPNQLYFGVHREAPLLVSVIDKALGDITAGERTQVDDRWVSLEVRPSIWQLAFKIAAALILVVAAAALLLFWHQRGLARELDERRRVQAALQAAHGQLAQLSDQKSELLRMVAHDIRGPLTGLLLTTELATMPPAPGGGGADAEAADLRSALAQVRLIGLRLAKLVDDLVTVQLVEDGRRVYQRVPLELAALVGEAVAAQQFEARRKQIEVRITVAPGGVPRVASDAVALRQVIDNLLSNALKYSPAGTQVSVEVEPFRSSGCRISVRDRGPGISAADMGKIFQRYGRGQARPTAGEHSLGLGLWIAQRIVADLGGTLRCESVPGQGATFIVELPGQ